MSFLYQSMSLAISIISKSHESAVERKLA